MCILFTDLKLDLTLYEINAVSILRGILGPRGSNRTIKQLT